MLRNHDLSMRSLVSIVGVLFIGATLVVMTGCGGGGGGGGGVVSGTLVGGSVTLPGVPSSPSGTPSAAVSGATIEALDADGNVIASTMTDSTGAYTFRLPDGTFKIGIRSGSTSYFSPLRENVIVQGSSVQGTMTVGGTPTLDFTIPEPDKSMTGQVNAGMTGAAAVIVEFVDVETNEVRFQVTTASDGSFSATVLPQGRFSVQIDSNSVPTGFAVPTPQTVAVTDSGVTPATVTFTLPAAVATPGTITSTAGAAPLASLSPVGSLQPAFIPEAPLTVNDGAQVIVFEVGYGEVARFPIDEDGGFQLNLRDGSYTLEFTGFGADVVAPPPAKITVKDGLVYTEESDTPFDPASDSLSPTAAEISATLSGTVTRNGSAMVTRVIALDPATGGVLASANTTATGAYSIPLADGSYDITIAANLLPAGVVPPTPVRVAIEAGDDPANPFREEAGTANDGVVNFTLTAASIPLAGTVMDDMTNTLGDVRIRAIKGTETVARAVTNAAGEYTLQLPVGTIDILINRSTVPTGLLAPSALRIEVALVSGVPVITDASGTITDLDFTLETRSPNLTGTITFDFNGNSTIDASDLVGCRVLAFGPNEQEVLFDTASDPTTGQFRLTLPNGTYVLGLDAGSLPPGSAPPPRQRISVAAGGVTTPDGMTNVSATVDFRLVRRASTLTGLVTINARGTSVGLRLVDLSAGSLVSEAKSAALSGAYRMPMFPGAYELRIDPATLPAGTAIPNPIQLSVASDGTISTTTGDVTTVDIALTRNVALLTGTVEVSRSATLLPLEVEVVIRDPQTLSILQTVRTDSETGEYSVRLLPGSKRIGINPDSVPPGVQLAVPQQVSVAGTTITGDSVSSNSLDFVLQDIRVAGVVVQGNVFDADSFAGVSAELRLFDPNNGSLQNFLAATGSDASGNFSLRVVEGTYTLAVFPDSLAPTALPPAGVTFSVQGTNVIESNSLLVGGVGTNNNNDGTVNFRVRDGASSGITVTGTVADSMMNAIPGVRVRVRDSATSEIVGSQFVDPQTGGFSFVLPLGSYFLGVDANSLPFTFVVPQPKSVQAIDNGGIQVTTNNGVVVAANMAGAYEFDFTPTSASQALTGTVLDDASNAVRVFVRVHDATTDDFILGRWSDETAGTFQALLSPGAYLVGVDPPSVPFGTVAPAPVAVTVTASSILEDVGTSDDGSLDFQLLAASRNISGTVLTGGSDPVACFVIVENAQTGEFVNGAPTMPSSGSYQLVVPPGIYKVFVDPPSLPPGFTPPANVNVDASTSNPVADFTINVASQCITGTVLTDPNLLPLNAFVRLENASTGQFIMGVPTDLDGSFTLCAGAGSYKIKVDQNSLPAGTITPTPVTVQITNSTILEDNTAGMGNAANDGTVNFRITEETAADLAQLSGTVTLSSGGSSFPLGAFIFIEETNSGQFVNGIFSDPATGNYTLLLPAGSYRVFLEAGSLPPGVALPAPTQVSVASDDTITIQVEGVPVVTNTLDFTLEESQNTITGTVQLSGNGFPCFVELVDQTDTDLVFVGVPAGPTGAYSMEIPNGSFRVRVSPFSLPPGVVAPAGVNVTASSGFVTESQGTANDSVIDFALGQSGVSLSGYVVDDQNADVNDDASNRLFAFLTVIDTASGFIVSQSPTAPDFYFDIPLVDGVYDVLVDPPSLPLDVVPPVPTRITVSGTTITLTTAGDGALDPNSRLRITATRQSIAATVNVTVDDGAGNDVGADVRVRDAVGNTLFTFFVPPTGSGTDVLLGNGSFTLSVLPGSVPPGFSIPDPTTLTVAAGTPSSANVAISLVASSLTGTVYNAVSMGTTLVELDLLSGAGNVLSAGLTLTQNGNDATYDVSLGDGSYQLRLRRATGVDSSQVLLPDNKPVTVDDGIVQNPDDDPMTMGVQVDLSVPVIAATISGNADVDGMPVVGLPIILVNTFNNRIANQTLTDGSGDYTLAVPSGFYALLPEPEGLAAAAPTAIPAAPLEVEITPAGDVSVIGQGGLCAAGGPNEDCTGVDFSMISFNPMNDAQINGTVETRPNSSTPFTPVEGAIVLLLNNDSTPVGATSTDANGDYTLFATTGVYKVVVDPFAVQFNYPIVPPPEVVVSVSGTAVTESKSTGTGNAANDGTVNFVLEGATGLVYGRVQNATGAGVGAFLIVTSSSATEIPDAFTYGVPTDPDGNFFLPIGEGSFKLWVDPNALPPGFVAPQPINFSVAGTTVSESNETGANNAVNDGILNPIVSSGGASVFAQVLDGSGNPAAGFVALLQAAPNPNDPPFFVGGAPTNPSTGNVSLAAANGSYFLEIDPGSVPPGAQTPGRVNLTVASGAVSFASGTETTTVGANTHAVLRLTTATTMVTGFVQDGMSNPIPTYVIAVDAGTQAFVKDAPVNPGSGIYAMTLSNGVYDLVVDPFALPPGVLAPSPVRVSISGANVSEDNDAGVDPADGVTANMDDDGIVNFIVASSSVSLTGYVRDPASNGAFANVGLFAADSTGEYSIFVAGFPADFQTGFFEIPVSTGTYLVNVDPYSIPPGLLAPAGVVISVSGSTITFPSSATTEVENMTDRLILELQNDGGGVSGTVTDSMGAGVPVFVIAENAANNQFMGGAPTQPDGTYTIPLPSGTFRIFVDPPSLPQGSVPPSPQNVTVNTSFVTNIDFTVETAGNTFTGNILLEGVNWNSGVTTVDCSDIDASVMADEATPISCAVVLLLPSQDPNSPPTFLAETFTNPSTGFFSLPVGSGTYQVGIDGSTLPPGVIPPPPLTLTVSGGSVNLSGTTEDCSNDSDQKVILLSNSSLSIDGVVEDDSMNPVGCFIEIVDANTGNFITGTPTNAGDGTFSLPLGDLNYELRVDPGSVPPGLIPPAPVTISTNGGVISVGTVTGTDYSGNVLTISLGQASGSVSGTVTDEDMNPLSVMVQAFNSSGDLVSSIFSDPGSGDYNLALAPGIYEIAIDPFSLPSGFAPPPTQNANLLENVSAMIDFEIGGAPGTISGKVFYDEMGTDTGVPGFVEVFNATTNDFVAGVQAQPDMNDDFVFSLNVGAGTYRIGVDPGSVPPGFTVPQPVNFTVNVNEISGEANISESNTTGDGNASDDGTISFELQQAGATLTGQIVYDDMGTPTGLFAFVRVEQADGTGATVAEAGSDGQGNFSLALGDGTYLLRVDPGSLPPGFLPPPAESMTVSGSSIVIEGNSIMGTHQIQVVQTGASLSGTVTRQSDASPIQGVFVAINDPETGSFVAGVDTAVDGTYAVGLGDGTYLVQLDPFTLPGGLIPPAPTEIVVSGANITVAGSPIANLDIAVSGAVATVTIDVRDDQGGPMWVEIELRDQTTDNVVTNEFVNGAPVMIGLPAGDFFVVVPPFSLPPGSSSPAPVSLVVNGDGTTVDGSGSPSDGFISITVQQAAVVVGGTVTFDGSAAAGVKVAAIELQSDLEIASAFTDTSGMFSLFLPTGEFDILPVEGLPGNAVPPAPLLARVFGPGNVDPSGQYDFDVVSAAGSVSGAVTLDGVGVQASVLAFVDNMGTWEEFASTETAPDGTYDIALPEDMFVVIASIHLDELDPVPAQIIAPLPFDADVDTMATTDFMNDFDFFTPGAMGAPAHQILRGAVTAGGASIDAPLLLTYQTKPMALSESPGGDYSMAIMADMSRMFDVGIFGEELPTGYTPPADVTITVDGTGITGTGVTPDMGEFVLDFDIDVNGLALTGVVRDEAMNTLSGVEVKATLADGMPGPIAVTNSSGEYNMILAAGEYDVRLGGGLPMAVVAPLPVEVQVADNMGTLEMTLDGVASMDGSLDWDLAAAHAVLTGSVTNNMMPLPSEVIAYSGANEVASASAPNGSYTLNLPAGTFSVVAEPSFSPGGAVYPLPHAITVTDTGMVEQMTHNFTFDSVDPMNPGQQVNGGVFVDDMGYETSFTLTTQAGAIVAIVDTDSSGNWGLTLPPENYVLTIASEDLPMGIPGPLSTSFEVTMDGVEGPALTFGSLNITLYTMGTMVSGTVMDSSAGVPGVHVLFSSDLSMSQAPIWTATNGSGAYSLLLPEGYYEIELAALPANVVTPGIVELEVESTPLTQDFMLQDAAATISGMILTSGMPAAGEVIVEDMSGNEVSYAVVGMDGTYAIPLPTGVFTVFAELDFGELEFLLTPDPVTVTISMGADQSGIDFDFVNATMANSTTLTTRVLLGGAPTQGEFLVRKNTGGGFVTFAQLGGDTQGMLEPRISLTNGDYQVQLLAINGSDLPGEAPVDLTVANPTISVAGTPLENNTLDFTVEGGVIAGTIRNSDGTALSGASMQLVSIGGQTPMGGVGFADMNGEFLVSNFQDGTYFLQVDAMAVPMDKAPPRLQLVHISGNGLDVLPPAVRLGVTDMAGTLDGTLSVDGAGVSGRVHVFDHGLQPVASGYADMVGAFSFRLPAGTYTLLAELDSPMGNVPPVLTAVNFSGNMTQNIDFSSSAASATLTGSVSIDGDPIEIPVLIYKAGDPRVPVAIATPDSLGDYSALLPEDTFGVMLAPWAIPSGIVGAEPVSITVSGGSVAGTDVDGVTIANSELDLDPFGNSDAGAVRQVVSDVYTAILEGDDTALAALLHTDTLWAGENRTEVLASRPLQDIWGNDEHRTDHLVGYVTMNSADEYEVWVKQGRNFSLEAGRNTAVSQRWDDTVLANPSQRFIVKRDDGASPWLMNGNQLRVTDLWLEHSVSSTEDDGMTTAGEEAEFGVEESSGFPLASAAVAGTGIADGTLTQDGNEWYASVDAMGGSPSPFDATLASLSDGSTYNYTATTVAGPADMEGLTYNAPVAALYPTVTLTETMNFELLVTWEEITAQLSNPFGEMCLTLVEDPSGSATEVMEQCGMPAGTNWELIPGSSLQGGTTYQLSVDYGDTGGAVQESIIVFDWPLSGGALITGTVTDGSVPLENIMINVQDAMTMSPVSTVTTNASGNYTLVLAPGDYELSLAGLPMNSVPPSAIAVGVVDNMGTIEVTVDGAPSMNNVIDWTVQSAIANLTGQLLVNGAPADGQILAFVDGSYLTEVSTLSGSYQLSLPAGDVVVIASPFGPQVGLVTPAPYTNTITDTGMPQDFTYDFDYAQADMMNPGQTLNGSVSSDGMGYSCMISVNDSNDDPVARFATDMMGLFSITLAPGDYTVAVAADTLPMGFSGTSSTSLTVTANSISGPGYSDDMLVFLLNTMGTMVSGTVTDPSMQGAPDVVLVFSPDDMMLSQGFVTTDANGDYSILLADGDYEVDLALSTLPMGAVNPLLADITVNGSPVTYDVMLETAAASAIGMVTIDGVGAEAEVIAIDDMGNEVSFVDTDSAGAFTLPLVAGSYTLVAELFNQDWAGLLTPDPQAVTIVMGTDVSGLSFDFVTVTGGNAQVLDIRVLQSGQPMGAEMTILKDLMGTDFVYAFAETEFDGVEQSLQIALADGTYQLTVTAVAGLSATVPTVELVVGGGMITADGATLTNNELDIMITGGAFAGTIRDVDGAALPGATVQLVAIGNTAMTLGGTPADMDGAFSVSGLQDGTYFASVDPGSIALDKAAPRLQVVHISGNGQQVLPSAIRLGLAPLAGTLDGTLSVDGAGVMGRVHVLDVGLQPVATTQTDSLGAFALRLPTGTYTLLGELDMPGANVPPVLTGITFTGNMTQNIDFSSSAANATLTGTVQIDGAASQIPVLIYKPGSPRAPIALATPDMMGAYSAILPEDTFEVVLAPWALPSGIVAAEPVSVAVSGGAITGTDVDGNAIASNTLGLDPFGVSDAGAVRKVVSDVYTAILAGDATAFGNLLHTDTLWSGDDRTQVLANYPSRAIWGSATHRTDQLVGYVTMNNADEYEVWVKQGREFTINAPDGTELSYRWDSAASGDPLHRFVVKRDDGVSPWLLDGNQLHVTDMWLEHGVSSRVAGGMTTTDEEAEFGVEESSNFPLASGAVAGTGITDGTLTQDGTEWYASVNAMGGMPSPFDATLASLVDGGMYTYTATTTASPVDTVDLNHNAPVASLYPTISLVSTMTGDLLVTWLDVSSQLNHSFSETCLTLTLDPNGAGTQLMEVCGIPAGTNWFLVDSASLQSGMTYQVGIDSGDVGGALQESIVEFDWPLASPGATVMGTVSDGMSALAGVQVDAMDDATGMSAGTAMTDMSGNYTLSLGVGEYTLSLSSLPMNSVAPLDVEVGVVDNMGMFEITVDGVMSMTGVIDWTALPAVARLTGALNVNMSPADGEISAFLGGSLISEVSTNSGMYEVFLPVGDVLVFATPSSSTSGMLTPAPYTNTLTDTGMLQDLTHDFDYVPVDMMNPGQTLNGSVTSNGMGYECDISVVDSSSNQVALVETDMNGSWEITLSPDTYMVSVTSETLPMGFAGFSSTTLVVTSTEINGPGVDNGMLSFVLNNMGSMVSGTVSDPMLAGAPNVVMEFSPDDEMQPSAYAITDANGDYAITLLDGSYEVELGVESLPMGVVNPILADAQVMGGPLTYDVSLVAADASAIGIVSIDGVGALAEVIAFDNLGAEATFVETDAMGAFTLPLAAGTFTLVAELEQPDWSGLLTPDPQSVMITMGNDVTGLTFDFVTVSGGNADVLDIRVMQGGQPVPADMTFLKDISGTDTFYAMAETEFDGMEQSLQIALADGTYQLQLVEANGEGVMISDIELVVGGGAITADGQTVPNNELDIVVPVPLAGTIFHNGMPLAGASMIATPRDGGMETMITTDAQGGYSFDGLMPGEYYVTADSSSIPMGTAVPRLRSITVDAVGASPSSIDFALVDSAGDLTGQVTVDSTGAPGQVMIFDAALRLFAQAEADGSGNYSVPLPAGTYSVAAVLDSPAGTEVAPILSAIDFTMSATQDIALITGGTALSGTLTVGGVATPAPIIIYQAGPPETIHAVATPDMAGAYSVNLPDGAFEVMYWPASLAPGVVAPAPITLTVGSGAVTGTDMDGNAIASSTLDLEPFAMTDQGDVRQVMTDFLQAAAAGDTTAFTNLIHDVGTVFNGYDKTAWVADWSTDSDWGNQSFDRAVVSLTQVSADEWTCNLVRMRISNLTMNGALSEDYLDNRFTGSTETFFTIRRDSGSDPWLVAGNGNAYGETSFEHTLTNSFDGSMNTTLDYVEISSEEAGEEFTSASVAGTGVVDGTLMEMVFGMDVEWSAWIDGMSSGPSPFDAALANLVDGNNYTFTVDFMTSPQATYDLTYNAPSAGLFPTVEVSDLGGGTVLVSWDEITTQLARPFADAGVQVVREDMGMTNTMFEEDGLPLGATCLKLEGLMFQTGDTYKFVVEIFDAGGATQAYELEMIWP